MENNKVSVWSDPRNLDEAKEFASLIAASEMAGAHKGKAGNVLTCMVVAQQIGMPLLPVLQNVAIINSRPSIWGDLALALARRHPACVSVTEECDGEVAKCVVVRRTGQGTETIERTFSKADAVAAGLWGKNVWKQYPKRMLQMRARAFAIRDALPDALMGLAIAEEQQDTVAAEHRIAPKERMASLTAQLKGEPAEMDHDPRPAEMDAEDYGIPGWKAQWYTRIAEAGSVAELMEMAPDLAKVESGPDKDDLRGAWKARKNDLESAIAEEIPAESYSFPSVDGDE